MDQTVLPWYFWCSIFHFLENTRTRINTKTILRGSFEFFLRSLRLNSSHVWGLLFRPCYLQRSLGIVVLPGGLGPLSLTQWKQWRVSGFRRKGQNKLRNSLGHRQVSRSVWEHGSRPPCPPSGRHWHCPWCAPVFCKIFLCCRGAYSITATLHISLLIRCLLGNQGSFSSLDPPEPHRGPQEKSFKPGTYVNVQQHPVCLLWPGWICHPGSHTCLLT